MLKPNVEDLNEGLNREEANEEDLLDSIDVVDSIEGIAALLGIGFSGAWLPWAPRQLAECHMRFG